MTYNLKFIKPNEDKSLIQIVIDNRGEQSILRRENKIAKPFCRKHVNMGNLLSWCVSEKSCKVATGTMRENSERGELVSQLQIGDETPEKKNISRSKIFLTGTAFARCRHRKTFADIHIKKKTNANFVAPQQGKQALARKWNVGRESNINEFEEILSTEEDSKIDHKDSRYISAEKKQVETATSHHQSTELKLDEECGKESISEDFPSQTEWKNEPCSASPINFDIGADIRKTKETKRFLYSKEPTEAQKYQTVRHDNGRRESNDAWLRNLKCKTTILGLPEYGDDIQREKGRNQHIKPIEAYSRHLVKSFEQQKCSSSSVSSILHQPLVSQYLSARNKSVLLNHRSADTWKHMPNIASNRGHRVSKEVTPEGSSSSIMATFGDQSSHENSPRRKTNVKDTEDEANSLLPNNLFLFPENDLEHVEYDKYEESSDECYDESSFIEGQSTESLTETTEKTKNIRRIIVQPAEDDSCNFSAGMFRCRHGRGKRSCTLCNRPVGRCGREYKEKQDNYERKRGPRLQQSQRVSFFG